MGNCVIYFHVYGCSVHECVCMTTVLEKILPLYNTSSADTVEYVWYVFMPLFRAGSWAPLHWWTLYICDKKQTTLEKWDKNYFISHRKLLPLTPKPNLSAIWSLKISMYLIVLHGVT